MNQWYRLEHCESGDYMEILCRNRKEAHEYGASRWPGQVVEVCSSREYADRQYTIPLMTALQDALDDFSAAITNGDYPALAKLVSRSQGILENLGRYFVSREEQSDGVPEPLPSGSGLLGRVP